jgi:hypothetical protein
LNYLSHHTVARAVALETSGDATPVFFVGNVLPDLLSVSGDGRLRAANVLTPPLDVDNALIAGIRLHLATDTRFHGHPLFAEAMKEASEALRAVPFSIPLRRVFFLAHAFVEIALDGWLIRKDAGIAKDFYDQFQTSDLSAVVTDAGKLLNSEAPLLGLAHTLERFIEAQYLLSYAEAEGLAEALYRVSHRAKLGDVFAARADRVLLGECFEEFLPKIQGKAIPLLTPPDALIVIQ